jgi:hypothetical protein
VKRPGVGGALEKLIEYVPNVTIHSRADVPDVTIHMSTNLWVTWMRIAVQSAREARRLRGDRIAPPGSLLGDEFEASLVAVAASAHALDALYGSDAVAQAVRDQWRGRRGTPREAKIREALKAGFDTGSVNGRWVSEFGRLFDLRDGAAHATGVAIQTVRPTAAHPTGTNTSQTVAAYTAEAAEWAVAFALSVLQWCRDHPRSTAPHAVQWAAQSVHAIRQLEEMWSAG